MATPRPRPTSETVAPASRAEPETRCLAASSETPSVMLRPGSSRMSPASTTVARWKGGHDVAEKKGEHRREKACQQLDQAGEAVDAAREYESAPTARPTGMAAVSSRTPPPRKTLIAAAPKPEASTRMYHGKRGGRR